MRIVIALLTCCFAATALAQNGGIKRQLSTAHGFTGNGNFTQVPFNTTVFSAGGLSASGNLIGTASTAGVYTIAGGLTIAANSGGGPVFGELVVNGNTVVDRFHFGPVPSGVFTDLAFSTLANLAAGDSLTLRIGASSGNYTLSPSEYSQTTMSLITIVPESGYIPFVAGGVLAGVYGCVRLKQRHRLAREIS
jgi:hypothetical protein